MSTFNSLGALQDLPGEVRRSDLEERIRQLRACRSDAWSLSSVLYSSLACFQSVDNGSTQGGRRIYFRPRNLHMLDSLSFRVQGGGSEVEYSVVDDRGETLVTLITDTSGDAAASVNVGRTLTADTDYFVEFVGPAGTWSVSEADLDFSFRSVGLIPPSTLTLGTKGPALPSGGEMSAAVWNDFFEDVEDDYDALATASSFFQMRFAAMVYEPSGGWSSKNPRGYVFDTPDKFGGETVESIDVWACGADGGINASVDDGGGSPVSVTVSPGATTHGRASKSVGMSVAGSGVGTPIFTQLTEDGATSSLQRAYAVLHCRPLWE